MFFKNESEKFKTDINIKNLKEKDEDKVSFIHDSAIAIMDKIDDDIKTIGTRSTWLLGILIFTLSVLSPFAFEDFRLLPTYEMLTSAEGRMRVVAKLFCILSATSILVFAKRLTSSNFGKHAYNEPRKLLTKEKMENDIMHIKISEIEDLQGKIDHNRKRLKALTSDFDFLVAYLVISLIFSIALFGAFS